jgi:hypothetical protein
MDKLKAIPGIEKISISYFTPSVNSHHYPASILKYKDGEKEIETLAEIKYTGSNYISLYNIKLQPINLKKKILLNEKEWRHRKVFFSITI